MNVFRELRKFKNRNVIIRTRLLCIFLVMLIVSTYAWFQTIKEVEISGIEGIVSDWDVEYYIKHDVDEEMVIDEYTFATKDFYPGMENIYETIKIYNTAKTSTAISFEITSVKLFGNEILEQLKTDNEITISTREAVLFDDEEKYPFDISYSIDNLVLTGKYVNPTATPFSVSTMNLNVSWDYNGTDEKDVLDTGFGESAYDYYEANPEATEALVIKMKITASRAQ